MFTIYDLLHDASLENAVVFSSAEKNDYDACNLMTGAPPRGRRILWVADEETYRINIGADVTGAVIVCREKPGRADDYTEPCQGRETVLMVSQLTASEVFSLLQSAAAARMQPLIQESELAESLFSKRSITEIIDCAAKMMKSPIMLTTTSYKILAMNDAGLDFYEPIWEEALKSGYCSASDIMQFDAENITRKVWQRDEAFILDEGLAREIPRILDKISVFGKIGAYIGVFQIGRVFSAQDVETVELICKAVSVAMERDPKILNYTTDICKSILLDLLGGQITARALLNDRLRSAYWNPSEFFRCAVLAPDDQSKGIPNADYIVSYLSLNMTGAKVIRTDDGIMALQNFRLRGTREPFETTLAEIAGEYGLSVGISGEFSDLIALESYYVSAKQALRINNLLHNGRRITYFGDIIFYALVSRMDPAQREPYKQSKFKLLTDYDRINGTELCQTLRAYIDCGCSTTLTAQKLFVHRNTITHRLEKITEISGMDLRNGNELVRFFLSENIDEWNKIENAT